MSDQRALNVFIWHYNNTEDGFSMWNLLSFRIIINLLRCWKIVDANRIMRATPFFLFAKNYK